LLLEPGPEPKVLIADKGYDSDAVREDLAARKAEPVIPMRRNRKAQDPIDGAIDALRNLIERCFNKLKHSRRLATRYDKNRSAADLSRAERFQQTQGL
jgi:transposase